MRSKGWLIIFLYLAVSAVILSFIPPEQQLGSWIRLIIFHGNLSTAGLYVIYAAGVLGLAFLLFHRLPLAQWSMELGLISVVIWFVGTALSLVSMQVAWGGMMWNEPRTVAAFTIVIVGVGKEYLARSSKASLKAFAMANAGFAVAVLIIRQTLAYVMHPENPIGRSDSLLIRIFPMLLLAFTLAVAFEFTRWRITQKNLNL